MFLFEANSKATIWINYPVEKIFPDDPLPEHAEQSQRSNSMPPETSEAFQLVITPAEKPLTVELAISDLRGPQPFSTRQWTCHRMAYVDVPAQFIGVPYGRPGLNPDPLPRGNILKATKGKNAVFWVTVSVPPGCKPGIYQGLMTLRGDVACEVPLRLRVRGFSLPERPTICSPAVYRESLAAIC